MADKTPDQEPSIEEILASIRQIISDDDEKDSDSPADSAADEPAPVFPAAQEDEPEHEIETVMIDVPVKPETDDDEDILELTNPIIPERNDIEVELKDLEETREDILSEPENKPEPEPSPVVEPVAPPPVQQAAPRPEVSMNTQPATGGEDILTESARNAALSSMAKLAGNMPITRHREFGAITLEDLVREMLHPMLRDWVSENLPSMVERLVQKELEKLARQAQDV